MCYPCPPGRFANSTGAPHCEKCPKGHYAEEYGTPICMQCPRGQYQDEKGQATCVPCLPGEAVNELAAWSCQECHPGYYAEESGSPTCVECPRGTYQDSKGESFCKPCAPGYHVNSTGASQCKMCPKGFFAFEEGNPDCTKCEGGTYNDLEGQAQCKLCDPGTAAERVGATLCTKCSPGYEAPFEESTHCDACNAGQYSDTYGFSRCTDCEKGYFADASGMSSCSQCTSLYLPMTSSKNFTTCVVDEEATLALIVIIMAMTVIWILLPSIFQWRIGVDDVYAEAAGGRKRIIVRTQQSHWLSFFSIRKCRKPPRSPKVANLDRIDSTKSGATEKSVTLENAVHISVSHRVEIPVTFAQTGHPFLDTRPMSHPKDSWLMNTAAARAVQAAHELIEKVSSPMKSEEPPSKKKQLVQPLTRHHLLLLTPEGKPEERLIETSMGHLCINFPYTLIRVAPLHLPMLVWLLLALFFVIALLSTFELEARFVLVSAIISFVLALLLGFLQWRLTPPTLRQHKLKEHGKDLERANPMPQKCERGPGRAVQAGQLWRFFLAFETLIRQQRSMYYVVSNLLMPLTAKRRLSYAELVGPHQVMWFVSHFWGTSFRHFVQSVRKHAESVAPYSQLPWSSAAYWICSFSNNQWEVEAEVGHSWEDSSFFKTLDCEDCCGTAMILDDEAMPLTRAWCLFEVLQTKEIKNKRPDFEGLWLCTSTGVLHEGKAGVDVALHLAKRLSTLRLEDATASVQKDKDMIDLLVSQMPGGFDAMNRFVKSNIAEALRHMNEAFKKEFNMIMNSLGEEVPCSHNSILSTSTSLDVKHVQVDR